METFIEKIISAKAMPVPDIVSELYVICQREHASCNSDCPVYRLAGKVPVNASGNCPYHCNGNAMYKYIVNKQKAIIKVSSILRTHGISPNATFLNAIQDIIATVIERTYESAELSIDGVRQKSYDIEKGNTVHSDIHIEISKNSIYEILDDISYEY